MKKPFRLIVLVVSATVGFLSGVVPSCLREDERFVPPPLADPRSTRETLDPLDDGRSELLSGCMRTWNEGRQRRESGVWLRLRFGPAANGDEEIVGVVVEREGPGRQEFEQCALDTLSGVRLRPVDGGRPELRYALGRFPEGG